MFKFGDEKPVKVLLLWESPGTGEKANRRSRCLHLRRMYRTLQRNIDEELNDEVSWTWGNFPETERSRRFWTSMSQQGRGKRPLSVAGYNHYESG